MENRIDTTFASLSDAGSKAFIAYICAGDPDDARGRDVLAALDRAGSDIIELGVPFSDPLADGIVNQMAAQRALEAGANVHKILEMIRDFRTRSQTPIVLFTYLNPIYAYGFEKFHKDAAEAGADGILLLDLPPEEADANEELSHAEGLHQIRLIAPTTPDDRIDNIAARAQGFLYYVCREGVTGEQASLPEHLHERVDRIRAASKAPTAVGFGISSPEQAKVVASLADGVVVGSAIVRQVAEHAQANDLADAVHDFVKPLVDAVKSA